MPTVSVPVDRAIGKSLRLVEFSYQLALSHWPVPAERLQREIVGYEALNGDPAALARTFERDKVDLRELDVPLETKTTSDGAEVEGYRIPKQLLFLPAPSADATWTVLRSARPVLQELASSLAGRNPRVGALAMCALLPLARDLELVLPPLALPAALQGNTAFLIEWVHAMLVEVAHQARAAGHAGLSVPVERVAVAIALEPELVWRIAERGADRPPGHTTHAKQRIRIEAPARDEGVAVMGRLDRPWRPRAAHVDALLDVATDTGIALQPEARAALRAIVRGNSGAVARSGAELRR